MTVPDALRAARETGLDLVEVAPQAAPPVCRIMDFGKYKYELDKKASHKKTTDLKEVKLRLRIEAHDLELKIRNLRRFLDDGHKAKVTMYFRGRENARPELGMKVFEKIVELLPGKYALEQPARLEGNHITMVVAPK